MADKEIREIVAEMLDQMRQANELLATQRKISEQLFLQIDDLVKLQQRILLAFQTILDKEFSS
jgi:hypothetical protein